MALDTGSAILGEKVMPISDLSSAIELADVVIIAAPANAFTRATPQTFAQGGKRRIVIDCWRLLPDAVADVADVVYLGRGSPLSSSRIELQRWTEEREHG